VDEKVGGAGDAFLEDGVRQVEGLHFP
jgi:hypothetical protein